jgi:FAD/FMN-containing dehydrogenase
MTPIPMTGAPDQLLGTLAAFAPVYNRDDMGRYLEDWSGLSCGQPCAVLRPASPEEVSAIVAACHGAGRRLTIQGGMTGLAGGALPDDGDVVLSLERLNRVEEFDTQGGTVTVQAGITLQALCELVEEQDWYFPLDCGARGSCQIGGNVATNAGGNRVLRYGTMRELVLGLEVVLPDGARLTMLNKVIKNNTGLDLKHLFIGSEGTLGVITRVVLKLYPKPQRRHTALCALASFEHVARFLKLAKSALPTLSAFEVMWRDYLQTAAATLGRAAPFGGAYPLYVLLETEGSDGPANAATMEALLQQALELEMAQDVIIPQSAEQAAALWLMRDAVGEILPPMRPYAAFDVGIPVAATASFVDGVGAVLRERYPDASHLFFGHLGDGNLHLATGPHPGKRLHDVEELVYAAVAQAGGSISAEHGIGRLKKAFLKYTRGPAEIALMQAIKQTMDDGKILNNGRIVD